MWVVLITRFRVEHDWGDQSWSWKDIEPNRPWSHGDRTRCPIHILRGDGQHASADAHRLCDTEEISFRLLQRQDRGFGDGYDW